MIAIPTNETDDSEFIDLVSNVTAGPLTARPVEEVFVVRIDNWFDDKSHNFSEASFPSFPQSVRGPR
jgi:hypothetical protein